LVAADVCDAVVIATPNHTHHDVLLDLLPTDLHLLVEKPLCTTVPDCRRVLDAAEGREAVVWVGLEYRYMPPVARLVREVRAGAVGRVRMVHLREHRFPFLPKVGDWNRFSRNTGGTLVEKCCHFFDLMAHIVGERPERVMASGAQDVNHLDERYDGEVPDILDNAYVIVEFPGGARGLLDLCMFAEGSAHQEEVVVVGDVGKVEAFLPDSTLRTGRRADATACAPRPSTTPSCATRASTTAPATWSTSTSSPRCAVARVRRWDSTTGSGRSRPGSLRTARSTRGDRSPSQKCSAGTEPPPCSRRSSSASGSSSSPSSATRAS